MVDRPDYLFQSIEKDPNSKYEKIILDYTVGIGKIYNVEEIKKKMQEAEFPREYQGVYLGKVGNIFSSSPVQTCVDLGSEFDTDKIPVSLCTLKSVGIDPGFSSSSKGLVTLEHTNVDNNRHIIHVIDCHLIDKGDPNQIVNLWWDKWKRHNFMNVVFCIDGSNRAMVNLLKFKFCESLFWENTTDFGNNSNIRIRPINFNTEHKNLLSNLHAVVSKAT